MSFKRLAAGGMLLILRMPLGVRSETDEISVAVLYLTRMFFGRRHSIATSMRVVRKVPGNLWPISGCHSSMSRKGTLS